MVTAPFPIGCLRAMLAIRVRYSESLLFLLTLKPNPNPNPNLNPGLLRATAGLGKTFLQGPQTFLRGPSREKNLEFFFQNGTFWCTLYFRPTAGPPKRRGARGSLLLTPPSRRACLNPNVSTMVHICTMDFQNSGPLE